MNPSESYYVHLPPPELIDAVRMVSLLVAFLTRLDLETENVNYKHVLSTKNSYYTVLDNTFATLSTPEYMLKFML